MFGGMCGVTRRDRVRNEEIRKRCGLQKSLSEKGKAAVVRWFGHIERVEEARLVEKIYRFEVEGNRGRGRSRKKWINGVKSCLSDRGLTIPVAKDCVKDREKSSGDILLRGDVDDPWRRYLKLWMF